MLFRRLFSRADWGFVPAVMGLCLLSAAPVSARAEDKLVYFGLSKNVAGAVTLGKETHWKVTRETKTWEMFTGPIEMSTEVTSGGSDADEFATVFNGKIQIHWDLTARSGPVVFGTHTGRFVWTDGVNRAEGTLEGTFGCGTFRKPLGEGVKAREPMHFEGLLKGAITAGSLKGGYMEASYSGKFTFTSPTASTGRVMMTVDGVHIQKLPEARK